MSKTGTVRLKQNWINSDPVIWSQPRAARSGSVTERYVPHRNPNTSLAGPRGLYPPCNAIV
jgi:hypothetical protein